MELGSGDGTAEVPQHQATLLWSLKVWHAARQYVHEPPEAMAMTLSCTCMTEFKMAAKEGAGPKWPVSLAWGKEGIDGEVGPHKTHESLGS